MRTLDRFFVCVFPILTGAILLFSGCKARENNEKEPIGTSENVILEEPVKTRVNPMTGMAELQWSDIAFRLGSLSVTWGELRDYFNQEGIWTGGGAKQEISAESMLNGLDEGQQLQAKKALEMLVRNQILRDKVLKNGTEVSNEERKEFEERWKKNNKEQSFEEYLSQFPEKSTHRLQLNREEVFQVLKYADALLQEVEIPADVMAEQKQLSRQMYSAFAIQEEQRKKDFMQLAMRPEINTDEGFAALAKEFSEGIDADNGGVLDILLTRKELTELNFNQPFTTLLGETSPLIETPTGLRYVRVLEVVKPEQTGGEERLKIAQIFLPKNELEGVPTEEEVGVLVTNYFQEKAFTKKLEEFLEELQFECPLFPDLRKEWPAKE